jgi:hypothetical protein
MRDFSKNLSNYMELGVGATAAVLSGAEGISFSLFAVIDSASTASITENRLFAFTLGSSSGNDGISAMIDGFTSPGNLRLRIRSRSFDGESVRQFMSSTNLLTGTLTHIAGACDIANDTIYIWIDGAQESTAQSYTNATYTVSANNSDTDRIGTLADANATAAQFDGALGEIAFWRRTLVQDEVTALSRGMSPLLIDRPTFYWPLTGLDSPEPELVRGLSANIAGSLPQRTEGTPVLDRDLSLAQNMPGFAAVAANTIPVIAGSILRQMAA